MIEILQKIIDAVAWDQQNLQNQSVIDKKNWFFIKGCISKIGLCNTWSNQKGNMFPNIFRNGSKLYDLEHQHRRSCKMQTILVSKTRVYGILFGGMQYSIFGGHKNRKMCWQTHCSSSLTCHYDFHDRW